VAEATYRAATPTYGYEPTREAAMAAFAKSWRRDETVRAASNRIIFWTVGLSCLSETAIAAADFPRVRGTEAVARSIVCAANGPKKNAQAIGGGR
jgi:hypothetical protein